MHISEAATAKANLARSRMRCPGGEDVACEIVSVRGVVIKALSLNKIFGAEALSIFVASVAFLETMA